MRMEWVKHWNGVGDLRRRKGNSEDERLGMTLFGGGGSKKKIFVCWLFVFVFLLLLLLVFSCVVPSGPTHPPREGTNKRDHGFSLSDKLLLIRSFDGSRVC